MGFESTSRLDSIRRRLAFSVGFASLLVQAGANAQTVKLERTDAFEVAFGMSFQLDRCADSQLGDIVRQAILEKFDHCPFTDDARSRFRSWTEATKSKAQGQLGELINKNGSLPDKREGMSETCSELKNKQTYIETKELFSRYARGEISADAVVTDRCDVRAGAP